MGWLARFIPKGRATSRRGRLVSPKAAPPKAAPKPTPGPSDTDTAMMQRALGLAREASAIGEVPVGAVVYETATGRVLAEAHNRREADKDPAAHAELIAMRSAARALGDWRLSACTVVVTLEPCPMCAGLLVSARVGRLVYGAADPKAGAVATLYNIATDPRLNHTVTVVPGVLADDCAELLSSFFRELRRRR